MNRSENLNELAAALAKAQGQMQGAVKDTQNPHFRSTFASLESCWNAIREPFSKNGLSVVQTVDDGPKGMELTTMLMHMSGQWLSGSRPLCALKQDPQGIASAITYARRFDLMTIAGIATTDDDGEEAMGRSNVPAKASFVGHKPAQADYERANPNWVNEPATEAQIKRLFALRAVAGVTDEQLKELILRTTDKEGTKTLTKAEIQNLFEILEARKK